MTKIFTAKRTVVFISALCVIFFTSFFFSCSKEKLGIPMAINDLILDLQLKYPACTCEPYIKQYVWRNEDVYVLAYKGPACDWFPGFYHSSGRIFSLDPGYTYQAFLQESRFEKTVWTCKGENK